MVVVGGDIVPGPMPRETLVCLLNLDIPVQFIQGNCEIDALAEMTGAGAVRVPEQYREIMRWSAQQLFPEYEQFLAGWAKTLRIEVSGLGAVLFCHATPRDDNEIFTRLTPEEHLLPIFEGLGVSLVVCGHTHMQFDRTIGKVRVVNAGSVGMPFGEPGADWLLLGADVQLRHTPYDLTEAAECIRRTSYPQAQAFAENYVLQPPKEEQMLEVFARAELR
ncbi:MAG: metallophosphoesterase family protein [Pyrinomonadaceae bacterium]